MKQNPSFCFTRYFSTHVDWCQPESAVHEIFRAAIQIPFRAPLHQIAWKFCGLTLANRIHKVAEQTGVASKIGISAEVIVKHLRAEKLGSLNEHRDLK